MNIVDTFIESKKLALSATTLRTMRSRLRSLGNLSRCNNGELLFKELTNQGKKPYTIKTTFINVSRYTDWLISHGYIKGPNRIKKFLQDNSLLFKSSYNPSKKHTKITMSEAKKRISKIRHKGARRTAELLLRSGLRYSESKTLKNGYVLGKGKTYRRVYGSDLELVGSFVVCNYSRLVTELKKVGLTPHMLRKIFATSLARKGAGFETILKVMGWRSPQTALSYIAPIEDNSLDCLAKEVYNA